MTIDTARPALLDVNVLLALTLDQHVHHAAAHRLFPTVAAAWATTPITESGLVRLLLTPQVVGRRVMSSEAVSVLNGLRAQPGWEWWSDDASFADTNLDLRQLMGRRQVTDMHLLDLAVRRNGILVSFDAAIPATVSPAHRDHVVVWAS